MNSMPKAVLWLSLGLLTSPAWADTTSLPLTDDAWINANNPGTNFGLDADIFVHSWGPKEGLVRFDAATISGQTVTSATLELYLGSIAASGEISIHAITSSWNETTVTWNNRPPAEAVATAIVSMTTSDAGSTVTIDVTAAVQRWADGSLADAGFLIVTSDSIKAFFDARERAGGVPATLIVESEGGTVPPPDDGKAIVLDLHDPDACNIDEPGYYVLDRNWSVIPRDGYAEAACGTLRVASEGVILDLNGFAFYVYYGIPLRIETTAGVTVRNGHLDTDEFVAIENPGEGGTVIFDQVRVGGAVDLRNRPVTVTGGSYGASLDAALSVGPGSRIEGARFSCNEDVCLSVRDDSIVRDCTMRAVYLAPTIALRGDNTIIAGNHIDGWMVLNGNDNVIARNFATEGTRIEINGARNVLDGNIGMSIVFNSTGNFFGNNRVALPGGFSGTDGNVDWGGNVSF
jgi:hypothetical protein